MKQWKTDAKGLILICLGMIIGLALKKANLWIVLSLIGFTMLVDMFVREKND